MGSNFVRYVLAKYPDYSVLNFDALTYAGSLEKLSDVAEDPRYSFVKGDVANEADVEAVFQSFKPDVVINFAAETHVDRSIYGPRHFVVTDVLGTFTLLEASRRYGVERYVQVSTDEVYGSIEEGEFFESSPFQPNSPYSASKAGADHLVRAYHRTYGLPTVRTHSCNVFGPYQYPEKIIPLFVTNLIQGKKVPLYGTGLNCREWIYVEDYCRALDLILHQGNVGEAYNIGTGWECSNLELTRLILSFMGKDESSIERVADRLGHDFRYSVNIDRLKALGFAPTSTFEARLKETVEWYVHNESFWKPLTLSA